MRTHRLALALVTALAGCSTAPLPALSLSARGALRRDAGGEALTGSFGAALVMPLDASAEAPAEEDEERARPVAPARAARCRIASLCAWETSERERAIARAIASWGGERE